MKTKPMSLIALLISLTAATQPVFGQDTPVEMPKMEDKSIVKPGSLTDVIGDSATFSILKKALAATGLDVTLGEKTGAFTLFAPTDEAFNKLPPATLDKLMLPENKEKLRSLILYHVIPGVVLSAELKEGELKTMNGEKVKIDIDGEKVKIDDSKIFSMDVMASNGVMHTLGKVLVPETLDGFEGLDR